MAEYIEREAATAYAPLHKELREYQTANLDDAFEYGYDFAIGQIYAIPAADVRPVVLCKDCANCEKVDEWEMWCHGRGSPVLMVSADGFCNYGRKK